jgi:hypothetical protein
MQTLYDQVKNVYTERKNTMTIDEILKAKGISDETIAAVLDEMKTNKIFTASEENLDIRYGKLKTQHDGVAQQLAEANSMIEELKKSNKGNDGLQQKITAYEQRVTQLQAELEHTKLESAIKVELLAAKALDVDYLTFKLKEKGELNLDDQGKIKGWDDKLAGLKTQFPTQFEAEGKKNIIENTLPTGNNNEVSKEAFAKMGYQDRLKLYNENPEAYAELSKN